MLFLRHLDLEPTPSVLTSFKGMPTDVEKKKPSKENVIPAKLIKDQEPKPNKVIVKSISKVGDDNMETVKKIRFIILYTMILFDSGEI